MGCPPQAQKLERVKYIDYGTTAPHDVLYAHSTKMDLREPGDHNPASEAGKQASAGFSWTLMLCLILKASRILPI